MTLSSRIGAISAARTPPNKRIPQPRGYPALKRQHLILIIIIIIIIIIIMIDDIYTG